MRRNTKAELDKLKRRYANHFKVPVEELEEDVYRVDIYIYHPKRPDLPQWSLGFNDD